MSGNTTDKCRLCLVETDIDKTLELFIDNNGVSFKVEADQNDEFSNLKLYQKVEYCCGVRLHNKKHLPSRICGKCFNTIHMWFNFRQMCYNSQVFLTTQSQGAIALDQELEDLPTVRAKLNTKSQEIIDCIEEVNATEIIYEDHTDDDDVIENIINENDDLFDSQHFEVNNTDDFCDDIVYDSNNLKTENNNIDYFKLDNLPAEFLKDDNGGLLQALTADDYDEAMEYINAEDDEELEDYIDHCATKNLAIKQLHAKALIKYKPKVKRQIKPRENKDQKKMIKLPKPTTFMCNICGNVYSKKPLFQHHMRMHSDVKPYQCELCDKSYRIMSDLKNHMYRHTGEKPFKCKFCERHFMDRSSRHRHERIHTNSRPYKCTICAKSFSYSAILKNHLKLHSGEKDYVCSICNKSFTLAHQLKAHMQTISHKQKEATYEASGYKILYETAVNI